MEKYNVPLTTYNGSTMSDSDKQPVQTGDNAQGGSGQGNKNQKRTLKGRSCMPTNGNGTAGFRGDTEEMTGHVFELPVKGNQYAMMLAVLKCYVSVTYDSGLAMASLFAKTPSTPTSITTPGSAPKATGKTKEGQALVTEFDTEMFKLPRLQGLPHQASRAKARPEHTVCCHHQTVQQDTPSTPFLPSNIHREGTSRRLSVVALRDPNRRN